MPLPITTSNRRASAHGRRRAARLATAFAFLAIGGAVLLTGCTPGEGASLRAVSQIGKPYVWGGASPAAGFDCSGLTMWSWKMAGKQLPRTAAEQYKATWPVPASKIQSGDLAFWRVGGRITHVAMYIGDGTLVQARKPGYPVESDHIGWWSSAFAGYRRVG